MARGRLSSRLGRHRLRLEDCENDVCYLANSNYE
eukprot:SAG11_NODE_1246_length_5402_cov_1.972468_4_plen_34_part_00